MGCPEEVAVCDAEALRLMKHAVRTSFGVSQDIIVRDGKNRLGGIGQGSGNGPMSWHSHMLALIDAYEAKVPHRAFFNSPDKSIILEQWLVGFVDDNTILFTLKDAGFERDIIELLSE